MGDVLLDQVGFGAMTVMVMQLIKKAPFIPWLNENSELVNRIVGIVVALFTGIGVHFAVQGDMDHGGSVVLTYPPLQTMVSLAVHSSAQWMIQQSFYKSAFSQPQVVIKHEPVAPAEGNQKP